MSINNGRDSSNIASLADARQRAADKAKADKRAAAGQASGPRTTRDWIFGGLMIAAALAYLASLLWRASLMLSGGAA